MYRYCPANKGRHLVVKTLELLDDNYEIEASHTRSDDITCTRSRRVSFVVVICAQSNTIRRNFCYKH